MRIEDVILGMEVEYISKEMIVIDKTIKGKVILIDIDGNQHIAKSNEIKSIGNIDIKVNYNDAIAVRDYLGALTEDDNGYTNDSLYRFYNKLCDTILEEKEGK